MRGYFTRTKAYENRDGGRGKLRKPLPEHGTRQRYRHRIYPCKCDACKMANKIYLQSRVHRRRKLIKWVTSDGITKQEINDIRKET